MSRPYGAQTDESRHLDAKSAEDLYTEQCKSRGTAPITYQLLFVRDGAERLETFECLASQRADHVRRHFGISLDNVPFALRNKGTDGRWKEPIGDKLLCSRLRTMR